MADYLLIESRDPFDSACVGGYLDLAADLAGNGNKVTLLLVQNGVLPARNETDSGLFRKAADSGVEILAEEFSLRERGIGSDRLAAGVKAAPLEVVIDHMAAGSKVIWH